MPEVPLAKVRDAITDNLYPQGPVFHWRDGWYFCRGEGLVVHIWNVERSIDLTIPDNEWKSITRHLKD